MAKKLRDFTITLYPATLERGFYVTTFAFGETLPQKQIQAATAQETVTAADAFALEHGVGCHASIRLVQGRKPAGFDAKTKDLYYNIPLPLAS